MKKSLKSRLIWVMHNISEIIAGFSLAMTVMLTVVNVITRYIFRYSIIGIGEIISILFCWTVFAGIPAAYKSNMHFGIDIFVNMMPEKLRHYWKLGLEIFACGLNLFLTCLAIGFTAGAVIKTTTTLGISYLYIDSSMIFGFGMMSWYSVKKLVKEYLFKKHKRQVI